MQYAIDNLMQLAKFVASITDWHYNQKLKLLSGASIGQHVRHIVEFYQCLQTGYHAGIIDYSARERSLELESDKAYAHQVIIQIISFLNNSSDKNLMLKLDDSLAENMLAQTSLNRELAYNLDHSIHHQAIIKMGMQELMPNYSFAPDFGLAPSTQRYLKEMPAQKSIK